MPAEKNTSAAFIRSFRLGFGTETDLRDFDGRLVISHDPARAEVALPAESFFEIHRSFDSRLPLALNVKSDGLYGMLAPLVERFSPASWFVFDMSIPDALGWLRIGAPVFTRQSELEPDPAYYNRAAGVWLDAFYDDWWTSDIIRRHLDVGKRVCIVSPELHGRDPSAVWGQLASADNLVADPRLMLCTDRPEEAQRILT